MSIDENVLITYVSKDPELNRIGWRELVKKGLTKVYLLYDCRVDPKTKKPIDSWAKISLQNVTKVEKFVKESVDYELMGVDPNNIYDSYLNIIKKEKDQNRTVYVDGTSLRRITLAWISSICMLFGAKLFLVVPKKLHDPYNTFIIEDDSKQNLSDWSEHLSGKFESVQTPTICVPKFGKSSLQILSLLISKIYH